MKSRFRSGLVVVLSTLILTNIAFLLPAQADLTDTADLQIVSMVDSPDPVAVGGDLTYAIVVRNNGKGPGGVQDGIAYNVSLQDVLPIGVLYKSSVISPDRDSNSGSRECTEVGFGGSGVICDLKKLAKGETVEVDITITARQTGLAVNYAEVFDLSSLGIPPDPDPSNNYASSQTTVGSISTGASLAVGDATVVEGASGTTDANFTVSLTPPAGNVVTVDYATANQTATAPSDYQSASGTLTFQPGETRKTVTVKVNGDAEVEPDESFLLNLTNPSGATVSIVEQGTSPGLILGAKQGKGTILNDDPPQPPQLSEFSITDQSMVVEGNSGDTDANFIISLKPPSLAPASVTYTTVANVATADVDYRSATKVVTFAPGEFEKAIAVKVIGDTQTEGAENFLVKLSSPVGGSLSSTANLSSFDDSLGVATIVDDDGVISGISVGDATVAEGASGTTDANFTVSLSPPASSVVTVDYATANDTATAPTDYQSAVGTLTFQPGETRKTVTVKVNGDSDVEQDESFLLNLTNPVGADIRDPQGVPAGVPSIVGKQGKGTILTDDLSIITIADTAMREGNFGTSDANFIVTLSPPSLAPSSVTYSTSSFWPNPGYNGVPSAQPGVDFESATGSVTFAPGEVQKTISIKVKGDIEPESDEQFGVYLINPVGASFSSYNLRGANLPVKQAATALIVNDDNELVDVPTLPTDPSDLPALAIGGTTVNEGSGTPYALAQFPVTLSSPDRPAKTAVVRFSAGDGSASDPSGTAPATAGAGDYLPSTGSTLSFAPEDWNEATKSVTKLVSIKVVNDTTPEPPEHFYVTLTLPVNATLARAPAPERGTAIILDEVPAMSIQGLNPDGKTYLNEGTTGETPLAQFKVKLAMDRRPDETAIVRFSAGDGTGPNPATAADQDYLPSTGSTVSFDPLDWDPLTKTATKIISLKVVGDTKPEQDEHFHVTLTMSQNASITASANRATAVIKNDDA